MGNAYPGKVEASRGGSLSDGLVCLPLVEFLYDGLSLEAKLGQVAVPAVNLVVEDGLV